MISRHALLKTSLFGLLAITVLVTCFVSAQVQSSETTSNSSDLTGATSPTRETVRRSEQNGRTTETRIVEGRSINGGYEPLMETEQQTIQVNANTVTVVKRQYSRDLNGNRQLVSVIEEQRSAAGEGRETVVRTTSNADANGSLQVVQRDVQETEPTGNDASETTSTIFRLTANGFQPVQRSQQTERRKGDVAEQQTTVLTPDGNGGFVPFSRTEATITKAAAGQTKDERIYRDNGSGKMVAVERDVTTESKDAKGTHSTKQTYSAYVPGATPDPGHMVLVQQVSSSQQAAADGSTESKQETQAINLGNPTSGLQPASSVTAVSQPAGKGQKKSETVVRGSNGNGRFGDVWVTDSHETKVVPQ